MERNEDERCGTDEVMRKELECGSVRYVEEASEIIGHEKDEVAVMGLVEGERCMMDNDEEDVRGDTKTDDMVHGNPEHSEEVDEK